jgi:hypothetical protein
VWCSDPVTLTPITVARTLLCLIQALLELRVGVSPELGPDLQQLRLEVDSRIPDILRVRITDPNEQRWEVPRELLAQTPEEAAGDCCLAFHIWAVDSWHLCMHLYGTTVRAAL